MSRSRSLTVLAPIAALAAAGASAQVQIVVQPDGSRLIHNRGAVLRQAPSDAPADEILEAVERNSRRQRLDPELVHAVIRAESGYDPRAVSRRGAMGLMQLMPDTARELAVADPWDPQQNIAGGTTYLRRMLDRFGGDLTLALAAYNAGPESVRAHDGVPPYDETRRYVERVIGDYRDEPGYTLGEGTTPGRATYVYRDARGRLVMTTTPPASRR